MLEMPPQFLVHRQIYYTDLPKKFQTMMPLTIVRVGGLTALYLTSSTFFLLVGLIVVDPSERYDETQAYEHKSCRCAKPRLPDYMGKLV